MRLRCNYNISGAETFRFSSSKDAFGKGLNLQNVPKGGSSKIAFWCKSYGATSAGDLIEKLFQGNEKKFWSTLDADVEAGAVTTMGTGPATKVQYRLLLPNVRKMFIPDPGYIIMDWDLDRADLQVVVWEADDADLKAKLRSGADLHSENAKDIGSDRDMAKRFIHGTNYVGSPRTMAANCGITVHLAELFQRRWFQAHPGIREWHRRIERDLIATRTVMNKFGYRRFYFDRIEEILPEAVAWVPQSTVAIVINKGLMNLYRHMKETVELLLQVHDSLVMQVLEKYFPGCCPAIKKELSIVVPYPDPLVIPVSCKWSSVSWGDCKELQLTTG